MAYRAYVVSIKVSDHPDPEVHSIALGNANGNTVVVSKKVKDGDLGIYFECDGQLSKEFALANDLIRHTDPDTGEKKGGLFDENRKVRAQKFRGIRSDGFWIGIESLSFIKNFDLSSLKDGDSFTEINGIPICNKFVTKATQKASNDKKVKNTLHKEEKLSIVFPRHFDTDQFRHEAKKLQVGDIISITEKIHGSSQRFGYVKVKHFYRKFSLKWFKNKLGFLSDETYEHVIGTRNVTMNPIESSKNSNRGFYEDETFRQRCVQSLIGKLYKNEMIFFEVVGWTNKDVPIMPPAKIKDLKDKSLKKYGDTMYYSYLTNQGEADIYVYRIANLVENGDLIDLTFEQVKERCKELNIKHVNEICQKFIYDGDEEKLRELVESLTDGDSLIDTSHLREGVCVRAERYRTPFVLKNKSFYFKLAEGMAKEKEDYLDEEESA